MIRKASIGIFLLFFTGFFLYSGVMNNQASGAETVKSFDQDAQVEYLDSVDGEPVYISLPIYESFIYYKGEKYGGEFDSIFDKSLINGDIYYTANSGERELLLSNGEVIVNSSENIIEYDILNGVPVYLSGGYGENKTLYRGDSTVRNFSEVEDMKVIDGKIAVLYSKAYKEYLWYNGSVIDDDASIGDILEYKNKPLYQTGEILEYDLALEGEQVKTRGSVDDFRVIEGQLAVEYENGNMYLEQKNISYCGRIDRVSIINEKVACYGPDREKIFYGGTPVESEFDKQNFAFEYRGDLAYVASQNGSSFIVSDGEILTKNYSLILDPFSKNGTLYFTAARKGSTNVYRDGKRMTDHRYAQLISQDTPLIKAARAEMKLYRGQKLLKTAQEIDEPVISEKGLIYQYFEEGKSTLVTPERNITEHEFIRNYAYGDKGLAYIAQKDGRYIFVYNDRKERSFSDTAQLKRVNGTPYFLGERKGHTLLMKGHEIHTNLSEKSKPDFFKSKHSDEDYKRTEEEGKTYIEYKGEKYGPYNLPELNVTARTGNNEIAVITEEGSSEYLNNDGKKYGPYQRIDKLTIGKKNIFFLAVENEKLKLKQIKT